MLQLAIFDWIRQIPRETQNKCHQAIKDDARQKKKAIKESKTKEKERERYWSRLIPEKKLSKGVKGYFGDSQASKVDTIT
jgi:hypothetical protein